MTLITSLKALSEVLGVRTSTSEFARDTIHNLLKEVAGPPARVTYLIAGVPHLLVSVPYLLARVMWLLANFTHLPVTEPAPVPG